MIKFSKKHQNKEAASISKQYSGGVALPTIVMATFVVSLFSSVLFLYANDFISPLFSTLLIAILTFVSYTPMHEAVHGNISGNNGKLKWGLVQIYLANDVSSWLKLWETSVAMFSAYMAVSYKLDPELLHQSFQMILKKELKTT
jgi:hypothetical protein